MINHLQKPLKVFALTVLAGLGLYTTAQAQYCTFIYRSYSSCVGGNITNVTFAGINNSVPCLSGGGYRDFTGTIPAATVNKGISYPFSVTVGGASWLGGAGVWIDLDRNGVFDASEQVFTGTYTGSTAVFTGNIFIPNAAQSGPTTMRVVGKESGTPTGACGSASDWGEAQDYRIVIGGGGGNNAAISGLVNPVNLAFCSGNQDIKVRVANNGKNIINSLTVEWLLDGAAQAPLYWTNPIDTLGGAQKSDTVLTLGSVAFSATTARSIKIWTSMPNGIADTSNTDDTITVNIKPRLNCNNLPAYCLPTFSSWTTCIGGTIAQVTLGSFSHTTACMPGGGYRSMTDSVLAPVLFPGQTLPVSLTIGSASYAVGGGGAIWMDLNRNGIFDTGEQLFTGTYNSSNPVIYTYTGNISIPAGTTQGYVLMRVMGRESSVPSTTCGASGYGECNDYLVYIGASSPNNAGVTQVLPVTQSFCAGLQDIKARVRNSGKAILNNVTVEWSIDGFMQPSYYWFSPIDTFGGTGPNDTLLTIGQASFTAGSARTIKVWTAMPNSIADTVNTDDSLLVTIEPSVVGSCASYTLPTYCTPSFISWTSSCVGGNITNVTFAGINKNTTCTPGGNYYINYTGSVAPAQVSPGRTYPVAVAVGGSSYAGGCAAWIDYNKNGTFETSEYAFVGTYTGVQQTFTGNISIPFTAQAGYTVMRVIGSESNTPPATASCTSGAYYGEAQDYVVYIGERPSNNMAMVAQTAPFAFCPGSHDIQVRVANRGKNQVGSVMLEWTVNGAPQSAVAWPYLVDTAGGASRSDTAITLGNIYLAPGTTTTIKAWTSYPNGVADTTNTDDSITFSLKPAISGSYTIGAGGNYTTFAAAASELNSAGICGGVTFDVAAGTVFNESPLTFINPGNGTDSIVFRKTGTGPNPIINCTGTSAGDEAAVDLRGAKHVVFDGIDIRVTGTNVEYGYRLSNLSGRGSSDNTIRNSRIVMSRSNTASIGVVQTSNTALGGGGISTSFATSNHNNVYKNLRVENVYNGMLLIGDYTYPDTNCTVTSEGPDSTIVGAATANDIGNSSSFVYGIYFNNMRNSEISRCTVRNLTLTGTSAVQGIIVENSSSSGSYGNARVYNNVVYNVDRTGTSTSTATHAHGIRIELGATATAQVFNNVVYNITSTGNTSSANANAAVRGLSYGTASGTGTAYFYNNSVQVNNPSLNRTSAAVWKAGTGLLVLQNNILSNVSPNQASTAKHYVVYRSSGPVSSSNNLLWTQNTNGFTGYYTTDQATMQNWRTASLQDQQSFFYRPAFLPLSALLPNPADSASWAINGRAEHLAAVRFDVKGNLRPAAVANGTPDLGAYEFTPTALPPAATAFPATPAAGSTQVFFFAEDTVAKIAWDPAFPVPSKITVRLYSGQAPPPMALATNQVFNCYWSIEMPNGSYNYTITPHYKELWRGSIQNLVDMRVIKNVTGNYWYPEFLSTSDTVNRTLTSVPANDASLFVSAAYQYDPLPVKLIRFAGYKNDLDAVLGWHTASETNAKGFVVERSADGKTWAESGFVKAGGAGSYSFTDAGAFSKAGAWNYRLKLVDLNGAFDYSNTIHLSASGHNNIPAEIYPNPFSDRLSVVLFAKESNPALVRISDLTGKVLSEETFSLNEGINTLTPSVAAIKPGIYFITIGSGKNTLVKKVVKQ